MAVTFKFAEICRISKLLLIISALATSAVLLMRLWKTPHHISERQIELIGPRQQCPRVFFCSLQSYRCQTYRECGSGEACCNDSGTQCCVYAPGNFSSEETTTEGITEEEPTTEEEEETTEGEGEGTTTGEGEGTTEGEGEGTTTGEEGSTAGEEEGSSTGAT